MAQSKRAETQDAVGRWREAELLWRKHVTIVPSVEGRPPRAVLRLLGLRQLPDAGIASDSCDVDVDPSPSASDLVRLANDPAVHAFAKLALRLADATSDLAPVLQSFGIDSTVALELVRDLRRHPHRPLVAQAEAVAEVELQTQRVALMRQTSDASVRSEGNPHPAATLHRLALSALEGARSILEFRSGRGLEWECRRRSPLPAHLRLLAEELDEASCQEGTARFLYEEALQNRWYAGREAQIVAATKESPAALERVIAAQQKEMKEAADKAKNRLDQAKSAAAQESKAMAQARSKAAQEENVLASEWVQERLRILRTRIDEYRAMFAASRAWLARTGGYRSGLFDGASACETLLNVVEAVAANQFLDAFDGLDLEHLRRDVEGEIGELVRTTLPPAGGPAGGDAATSAPRPNPRPDRTPRAHAKAGDPLVFDPVERAVVLLLRDGHNPRSIRSYANDVGVNHSVLSRSEKWMKAWRAARQPASNLPEGSKDAKSNLEAWKPEFCENCRQEPMQRILTVDDESVRVCEECAMKLAARTTPRTS